MKYVCEQLLTPQHKLWNKHFLFFVQNFYKNINIKNWGFYWGRRPAKPGLHNKAQNFCKKWGFIGIKKSVKMQRFLNRSQSLWTKMHLKWVICKKHLILRLSHMFLTKISVFFKYFVLCAFCHKALTPFMESTHFVIPINPYFERNFFLFGMAFGL